MHQIWIISRREINAFFDTLMAYILLVVFLGVSGIFTWLLGGSDIFFVGQASLQGFFGVAFWTLFFFIPAVTMRMVAEEESSGTLELLATKPVKHYQIIAGKWLASWLLIVISLALTLPYYITVASLGPLDHGAAISGYLALLFVSGVYTSIGIFASSLTSNQIVAFILSLFIAFFFHFLFGQITTLLPQSLANLLEFLSMDQHYQTMSRGVIGIENIVYMITIILLGFVFATTALKRRLW